jgi:hypothetical protein
MTIGQLAARTGLSVRTLRFYADAGVLPESDARRGGAANRGVHGPTRRAVLDSRRDRQ